MAILSSPLFNAQQRLDLEDLNQLISGFRTDARLWVRQMFNTENMIIKGFQCDASVNQNELQVDIISAGSTESATFILAGRKFDSTTGQIVESPSDFSWFTIQSSETNTATGSAIRLTAEIPTTFRPLRGTTRLYAYVRLLNSQGTPITKAFWDPSANSGAGAEFNQSVNTANDLAISLEVVNAPITNTADLLGRIPLCTLSVDAGGQIRSVVDTRELFFKKLEDFEFVTTPKLTIELLKDRASAQSPTFDDDPTNSKEFILGEEVFFADLIQNTPTALTPAVETNYEIRLRGEVVGVPETNGDSITISVDKLRDVSTRAILNANADWAENVKPRSSVIVGSTSGAARMIETLKNNANIDDKNITSFYKMFQSLQTEIRKIKGTDYWYDAPLGSIHDTLRQTNSVIIGEIENARYIWNPDFLSITTIPFREATITVATQPQAGSSGPPVIPTDSITIAKADASSSITLTASTGSNTTTNFQIGSDTAETARNLAAAITRTDTKLLTTVSSNVITISTAIANINDLGTITKVENTVDTFTLAQAMQGASTDNLAAIRIFGNKAKFLIRRHDSSVGATGAINIPQGHVAYIKLPDLDNPNFIDVQSNGTSPQEYIYNEVLNFTDTTEEINKDEYNKDDVNVPQTGNSFLGRILVIPIERYVDDARNFWIAFHEDSSTNNLFVRGIGQIGTSEEVPIGEGVTDQTLAYIGAPSESDSTPAYPSIATIGAFTGPGAFVTNSTKANINTSIVATNENLTSAISDLNLVATTTKDATLQDKDMKIVGGGMVSFAGSSDSSTATLTFGADAFINIPGLPNARNTLTGASHSFPTSTGIADQVLAVTVNRSGTGTATLTFDTVVATSAFTPTTNKIVVARRLGEAVYVGINGSTRILYGESGPLDGAFSLFTFQPGSLPVQLSITELDNVTNGINRGASIGDAELEFDIDASTTENIKRLNLSITGDDGASRILRFPGASIDFETGKIRRIAGLTSSFWLGRTDGADGTNFDTVPLDGSTNQREVWYALALEFDAIIETAGVDPGSAVNGATSDEIRSRDVGKALARLVVTSGEAGPADGAISAPFGGSIPIGQVKVTVPASSSTINSIISGNIIQLGASGGGGGGGAGDASQSINNFINRLNLSTYNYFTPFVSSVFSTRGVFDEDRSTSGLALGNSGAPITSGVFLQTSQLIDDEYLNEDIDGIQRVEINAEWAVSNDGSQRTDPNARWFITKDITDVAVNAAIPEDAAHAVTTQIDDIVIGYIDNVGALHGVNLTNIIASSANTAGHNILFSENHNLYSGQRIRFSNLGNITIQNPDSGTTLITTDFYVHRHSSQAFSLHRTQVTSESDTTRMIITSTAAPVGIVVTLPAGVLPRVGETNTVEAGHFFSTTSNPATNLNIRLRVVGDAQKATRSQEDDGLLLGFAMFYDQDGADVDSVPRTLDNVAEILRSNHLSNTETTTAGYGVAGRGIVLVDGGGTNAEIAVNSSQEITINGTALVSGLIEIQEFEVTGMWTAPADCVAALIQGAGGGGSGGAGNSVSGPGGTTFGRATGGTGGGAGEYREDIVNITGGAAYTVTVGTGASQTASSVAGSPGNASTVVGTGVNISFAPGAGGNIGHTISGGSNTEQGEINTGLNTTFPIGTANFRGGLGGASPKGDGERAIGMFASTTSARESQFAIDSTAPIGDTTFLIRSASSGRYRFGPGSRGGYNEKAIGGLGDEGRFDTGGVISVAGGAAGGGGGWVDGSVGTASNPNPVNNGSTATFGGAGGRGGVRIFAYTITPTITT